MSPFLALGSKIFFPNSSYCHSITMHQLPKFFLLFSICFTFSRGNTVPTHFPNCPTYSCGRGDTISYPFWLRDNTTTSNSYCGYPGLGLICCYGDPAASLPDGSFFVKDISYSDKTLTFLDMDVLNQTCPKPFHNLTLDTLPLYYSETNLNLSFYFNCSSYPSSASNTSIGCLASGEKQSFVFVQGGRVENEMFDWSWNCVKKVVAAVVEDEVDVNDVVGGYGGAMEKGFLIGWRTNTVQCESCELSGGRCGYSKSGTDFRCFCEDGSTGSDTCKLGHRTGAISLVLKILIGIIGIIVGVTLIAIINWCFKRKKAKDGNPSIEAFFRDYRSMAPKRYNYSDIKKMTNSFKEKLGQGGYGGVYKGKLPDGRLVAVKVLNSIKGNGEEFINEVASIIRTSHVNIVALMGFCFEGKKRALVYEFMPNGSLEKFIHSDNCPSNANRHLGIEILYRIAVGIARGLEYLHRGCNTRILHFDIKPHNILLDKDFVPKISDFGLAKLCPSKESTISMMDARGTIGYIAPEVFSRIFGGVSHKSDVYSYGMMILEMIGGRKNSNVGLTSHSSETYFPHWIYKRLQLGYDLEIEGSMTMEEDEISKRMILVGLWCIQTDPSHRPSMSKVMDMLEGRMESLQIPPKPFLSSPPRSPTADNSTSLDSRQ